MAKKEGASQTEKEKSTKEKSKTKEVQFKGKYSYAVGRRKTSVAQVRIYKTGKGNLRVNNMEFEPYFTKGYSDMALQSLDLAGLLESVDVSAVVRGGGKKSQAEAVRHGISRALLLINEELKPAIKAKGWLTRDDRSKERKKPGLKKARKAPQWSKR